jgi:hypothetical protein
MIHHSLSLSPNKTNSAGQAYSSASSPRTPALVSRTNTFPSSVNDPYLQSNSYGMRAIPFENPTINAFAVTTPRTPNASSNKNYLPRYAFYTIADRNACPTPTSYSILNYQPSSPKLQHLCPTPSAELRRIRLAQSFTR